MPEIQLQLFHDYQWHTAASFSLLGEETVEQGFKAPGVLLYESDYVLKHRLAKNNLALSVNYPVDFDFYKNQRWPAFLLDILPTGAGRRALLNLYNQADRQAKSDWFLLNCGAISPPGNMRVLQASQQVVFNEHPGFSREEVLKCKQDFLEYARAHGAPVSGSTGAQGDAPKFLLTVDKQGNWHADGALTDEQAAQHFLVKFARGNSALDKQVLRYEAAYYRIARDLGLRVHSVMPEWEDDVLFVSRFDRALTVQGVERYGLESLCSVAGVADFGQAISLLDLCQAFFRVVDNPQVELTEFLKRDILSLALGNTDNHARNSALLKLTDGRVALSPLYDFAPMCLDPEGIVRICRWGEAERYAGEIDWLQVFALLQQKNVSFEEGLLRESLRDFSSQLQQLPSLLKQYQIDKDFIAQLQGKITQQIKGLQQL
jgi:serine/threonine-protein kinase HipA